VKKYTLRNVILIIFLEGIISTVRVFKNRVKREVRNPVLTITEFRFSEMDGRSVKKLNCGVNKLISFLSVWRRGHPVRASAHIFMQN
jgi:hypothetical protein